LLVLRALQARPYAVARFEQTFQLNIKFQAPELTGLSKKSIAVENPTERRMAIDCRAGHPHNA